MSASQRESVRATVRRLSGAQKTRKGAPAYSRFVNRPAGRFLAAAAFHAGLTPNQVTAMSAVLSAIGIALVALAPTGWWLGPAVFAALATGYALDSADGQLARLRGGGTPAGEWLDHVVDAVKVVALHLAVLVWWYRTGGLPEVTLYLPVLFTLVASVNFFVLILNDQIRRSHGVAPAVDDAAPVWRSLAAIPNDYGAMLLAVLILGWPTPFAWLYGALAAANLAFLVLALRKWFREMASLPRSAW